MLKGCTLTYGAFEAFRRLIVQFRTGEVDLEYLSDDISEMTSDPEIRKAIAKAIMAYMEDLEIYAFSSIKTMTIDERDNLRETVTPLVEVYLSEKYFIDEPVVTVAQQHERERVREERKNAEHEERSQTPRSKQEELKYDQYFRIYFCDECGERVQGLFNLDDHIGLEHFERFTKRYLCEVCTGMWLFKHIH